MFFPSFTECPARTLLQTWRYCNLDAWLLQMKFIITTGWQFHMAEAKWFGDLSPISLDPFVNRFCSCSSQKSTPWLKGKGMSRDWKSFRSAFVQESESLPYKYLNSWIFLWYILAVLNHSLMGSWVVQCHRLFSGSFSVEAL